MSIGRARCASDWFGPGVPAEGRGHAACGAGWDTCGKCGQWKVGALLSDAGPSTHMQRTSRTGGAWNKTQKPASLSDAGMPTGGSLLVTMATVQKTVPLSGNLRRPGDTVRPCRCICCCGRLVGLIADAPCRPRETPDLMGKGSTYSI